VIQIKPIKKTKGNITEEHYEKAREISEKERHQAALNGPDAHPLIKEELLKLIP